MRYALNFGRMTARPSRPKRSNDEFRIAILGDFSGRANARQIETGSALAERKPRTVDIDTFQSVFRGWNAVLRLPLGADQGAVELKFQSLDDFHPDQLYGKLDVFSELSALRQRLKNASTFEAAARQMQSWPGITRPANDTTTYAKPRGSEMPSGKLSDFARLIGQPNEPPTRDSTLDDLIRQVVAPHVVPAPHPEQQKMIAAVDQALSAAMRQILHHPDFQALEALWRSVDLLTRELETDGRLSIVLYDITADEVAADLSSTDELESSGFYRLLVEKPASDPQFGPLSCLIGNYLFDQTPPHAELLVRIGKVAAAAQTPFIAGILPETCMQRDPEEIHPLVTESWSALRESPEAKYLGLAVPRFMLRWPYGAATEPIESFHFEEFTPQAGLSGMLWSNGAILAGLLLGKTFSEQGLKNMQLGSIMVLGDVPFYYYTDSDGDQIALPSTERMVSENTAVHIMSQNYMPVISIRGRPEVRLGSFKSLGGTLLAGPWAPVELKPDDAAAAATSPSPADTAQVNSVEEFEAQAAAEAENELDALLADIAGPPATSDAELDAALAAIAEQSPPTPPSGQNEMDPELAALLADL
jgi:type VI secretion system protein ImpC